MRTKQGFLKTLQSFGRVLPTLLGVLVLISLMSVRIPKRVYGRLFTGNGLIDPLIGVLMGSIAGGNPVTSYIIGGEPRLQGISMG